MAEPPLPGDAPSPTTGAVGRGPGLPRPGPRRLGAQALSLVSPGPQGLRPARSGQGLRLVFSPPFSGPAQAPTPRCHPMRRAGEKTRMGAVLRATKTGRRDPGRGRRRSSLQARAGGSVPRPGTPGPSGRRQGWQPPPSIGGKCRAIPVPRPYPGGLCPYPFPAPDPGQGKTGWSGPRGRPNPRNRACPPLVPLSWGQPRAAFPAKREPRP